MCTPGPQQPRLTEDRPLQRCASSWRGSGPELQGKALRPHRCPGSLFHPSRAKTHQESEAVGDQSTTRERWPGIKPLTSTTWFSGLMSCTCGTLMLTVLLACSACKGERSHATERGKLLGPAARLNRRTLWACRTPCSQQPSHRTHEASGSTHSRPTWMLAGVGKVMVRGRLGVAAMRKFLCLFKRSQSKL